MAELFFQIIPSLARKLPVSEKFGVDAILNIASFGFSATVVIFLNIIIARIYGIEILGIFNLVYAFFIVFSQISAFGIHLSALKETSQFSHDGKRLPIILTSAIAASFATACVIVLAAVPVAGFYSGVMRDPRLASGIYCLLPALFFIGIDKVLFSFLNGLGKMRFYAFATAFRYLTILLFFLFFVILRMDPVSLPLILSLSEAALFLVLIFSVRNYFVFLKPEVMKKEIKAHFNFGARGFLGHALMDLNTRVDVIMIGALLSGYWVGIYSFAALVYEGLDQIAAVLRNNINPILARLKPGDLETAAAKGKKMTYVFMALLSALALIFYPFALWLFGFGKILPPVFLLCLILLVLNLPVAGYSSFRMILVQRGFPGTQTAYAAVVFLANIALNFALVPYLGIYGAALATALSAMIGIIFLRQMVFLRLGLRL